MREHGQSEKFKFSDLGGLLKTTFKQWNNDDAFTLAASVAYYAIFSLPAILIILINLAGMLFGKRAVQGQITQKISTLIGHNAAETVQSMIKNASLNKNSTIMTVIGIAILVVGATGLFIQLQKALNRIWNVKISPDAGIGKLALNRGESFGLILVIGFLMLISLALTTAISALTNWIQSVLPHFTVYLFFALNFVLSFGLTTLLFALIFKVLPDVRISFRSVWTGAGVTAFLFMIGKFGLGFYFGHFNPASAYGAAGTIILILLWIYYSCLLVFFGAEFTQAYAKRYGHRLEPAKHAVSVQNC